MSRPRTATEILAARGAFDKNPARERGPAPQPSDALRDSPPEHLTPEQQMAWNRIVSNALPGVLKNSDELTVEMASCLWAEFQTDPAAMPTPRVARLERLLAKMGATPQDRLNLSLPEPEDDEEF